MRSSHTISITADTARRPRWPATISNELKQSPDRPTINEHKCAGQASGRAAKRHCANYCKQIDIELVDDLPLAPLTDRSAAAEERNPSLSSSAREFTVTERRYPSAGVLHIPTTGWWWWWWWWWSRNMPFCCCVWLLYRLPLYDV